MIIKLTIQLWSPFFAAAFCRWQLHGGSVRRGVSASWTSFLSDPITRILQSSLWICCTINFSITSVTA
jgi:hypothetical protein